MRLSELLKNVNCLKIVGDLETEVCGLACDSRKVSKGFCFVAVNGNKTDGNRFVDDAMSRGAVAVISETSIAKVGLAASVKVTNARIALAKMSSVFFGNPSSKMTLIGITGTNGKTTTAHLLESILNHAGRKAGVLGTIEHRWPGHSEKATHTTPESCDLQKILSSMKALGVDSCAMEVSSHALSQHRVDSCAFDCAVFTNLTPEHLDYHENMEDYFEAKAGLFERVLLESSKQNKYSIVNLDDEFGVRLLDRSAGECITYGFSKSAKVRGENLRFNSKGISFDLSAEGRSLKITSRLWGKFNALNILAAAASAWSLGIDFDDIKAGVESLERVPGRFQIIPNEKGVLGFVDYAHTPDALENVLLNAREFLSENGGRLISVFGCGGDRDKLKRPVMGKIAGSCCDITIVTSDNPRTEDPGAIIDEILTGLCESSNPFDGRRGYLVEKDRARAIARAVEIARIGDVIVVAGKGHEDYQIIGENRFDFDDSLVLKKEFES
jgi:UDP-N-acetylmuramoyl-L-alanyl-D-glutamate--2,6-diaminopimelate ligase